MSTASTAHDFKRNAEKVIAALSICKRSGHRFASSKCEKMKESSAMTECNR